MNMTNESTETQEQKANKDHDKTSKKRAVIKATLIGILVGVMFIVSAKMVNLAMS
ncbi:hypothetical protein ACFODZ_13095 [Marinicella sediminis]|uniref:Uncharacterized protein n=1 Tax=Marinicella sediminis TaxID=1792834 RepID=A0ABV7JDC9_9GAMM|nr:hypothetical protein [Marinicella sediminis]